MAEATLRAFDGIDFIVRGEADYTLPLLLTALQTQQDVSAITGLTFKTRAGVINTPDTAVIEDLRQPASPGLRSVRQHDTS